jgi:hypothetical protein
MKQTLTVTNRINLPLKSQPIRHGVPWPQGAVGKDARLVAKDAAGVAIPLGVRTLNCWPDGSVQWSLLDMAVDLEPSGSRTIVIEASDAGGASPMPKNPVVARAETGRVRVGNGLTELVVVAEAGRLVESWTAVSGPVVQPNGFDAIITDLNGTAFSAAACASKKVFIEDANPIRAIVRVEGRHQAADGRLLLDFWVRFTVTTDREDVKVTYNYRNYEKAEPGVVLRNMALLLRSALPAGAQRMIVHANRTRDFISECYRLPEDFEIISSNTPDLERYPETHKGITGGGMGRLFLRQHELLRDDPMKKPWFLRDVGDFKFGNVFPPEWSVWAPLGLASDAGSLLVLGEHMLGMHPKSLGIAGNTIRYAIWPDWAGPFDITQGEGRTLDFHVGPLPPNATDMQFLTQFASWDGSIWAHQGAHTPVQIGMDIAHVRRCGVFAVEKLPAYDPDGHFCFERKVRSAWTPDQGILPTGHWHFGDLVYAQDWSVGANNDNMSGLVWFQEYLRSGRPECLDIGVTRAQHIWDVDIVAYSNDKYQNGGMCAHGPRHNHCAAYPSHMWFTELLFAYALTGDEEFKRGAKCVCDCLTFWINDPVGFGHVSADGRESGQPLINLAWCYQFIPDPRYLAAMKKVVQGSFMDKVKKYGHLTYMKPREKMPLIRSDGYGEWAAWEGLYWVWELTRDEELRKFMLSQLDWRLQERRMLTSGDSRGMDYNAAAYAYYLSGDRQWLDRVARPFRAMFRGSVWQYEWTKSMYYIKLAFEHGIVKDDDVLIS